MKKLGWLRLGVCVLWGGLPMRMRTLMQHPSVPCDEAGRFVILKKS